MRLEFSTRTMLAAWRRSLGICECGCAQPIKPDRPEYHHILEAGLGGDNGLENCQVLKPKCHRLITNGQSIPRIAKVNRIVRKAAGIKRKYRWPKRKFGT